MNTIYFEHAHRDEQRRGEWRRLDESLQQRRDSVYGHNTVLQDAMKYWLAKMGVKKTSGRTSDDGSPRR